MAKDVAPPPQFPWDQLKVDSMRSICRDLGFKQNNKRSVMTHFLESVSKVGLPRALDGAPASAAAAAPARTSKKRTRATAHEEVVTAPSTTRRAAASTGRRTRARVPPTHIGRTRARQKLEEAEEGGEEEGEDEEEEEERGQRPSPSKRSRISVVSNYNTRFRAARRGIIVSDPGPGRRGKRVVVLPGGEPVSASAIVGRSGRVRRGARAQSGGRQARRGSRTGARGRVRVEEQRGSSEFAEEGGEEETVSAASVVRARGRAKRAVNVRKRTVRVNGMTSGEEEKEPRAAKRARRERKVFTGARSRSRAGHKMVIDGIDVPPVSKAVSVAMKKKEMMFGDEDADGEEEEEHFEKAGEVPAVAGTESAEEEGMGAEEEEEMRDEGDQDQMPIDEGGPQEDEDEEEEEEGYEPIPEDASSTGNSNKENEAPEGEQEQMMEMDTIGAATATASTATDVEVEDELMTQAAAAAAALFGAGALATAALLGSPSTNGDESGGAEGNDNTATGDNNNDVAGDLDSFLM